MTGPAAIRPWSEAPAVGDILLTVAALLTAAVLAIGGTETTAQHVIVEVDGVMWNKIPLETQQTLTVVGPLGQSVVIVQGDRARIESAPCVGQICVARGWLQNSGDVAACVPNRTILRLVGMAPGHLDGVTQ